MMGTMIDMPNCPDCGTRMLRWAWFESEDEPYRWWYCLHCDLMGKGTEAIHVLPVKKEE